MQDYQRILLATDLTNASDAAAKRARQLADTCGATLLIAHAIEPIEAYGYPELADLQSPLIDSAKAKMSDLGKLLNVPENLRFIEFGAVKKLIPELAELHKVELIVLGSHCRHGVARLLGSSANAIAHHTNCDTMIVRHE